MTAQEANDIAKKTEQFKDAVEFYDAKITDAVREGCGHVTSEQHPCCMYLLKEHYEQLGFKAVIVTTTTFSNTPLSLFIRW